MRAVRHDAMPKQNQACVLTTSWQHCACSRKGCSAAGHGTVPAQMWLHMVTACVLATLSGPGTCRVTGTGTSSTLEAGQKLQVTATFRDAFLNAVVDAAQLQGTTLELAYTGPVSGVVPLTVQQIGGLRCAAFSTPRWCRRSC